MRVISMVLIAVLVGFAATRVRSFTAESMQDQIVAKEREELDALKNGRVDKFAELLADEAVFLNSRGPSPKADVVKHVANFKLLDYTMEDVRFVPVGPKTGLIVYKLTQKVGRADKEFMSTAYVSALWTERQGKWLCQFSQETPAR